MNKYERKLSRIYALIFVTFLSLVVLLYFQNITLVIVWTVLFASVTIHDILELTAANENLNKKLTELLEIQAENKILQEKVKNFEKLRHQMLKDLYQLQEQL